MMADAALQHTAMPHPDRNLHSVNLPADWSPASWRARAAAQQPVYEDATELAAVQQELRALPPLVTSWEIFALKKQLAEAQEGKRFLLQGGDCAENFTACTADLGAHRAPVLLQIRPV